MYREDDFYDNEIFNDIDESYLEAYGSGNIGRDIGQAFSTIMLTDALLHGANRITSKGFLTVDGPRRRRIKKALKIYENNHKDVVSIKNMKSKVYSIDEFNPKTGKEAKKVHLIKSFLAKLNGNYIRVFFNNKKPCVGYASQALRNRVDHYNANWSWDMFYIDDLSKKHKEYYKVAIMLKHGYVDGKLDKWVNNLLMGSADDNDVKESVLGRLENIKVMTEEALNNDLQQKIAAVNDKIEKKPNKTKKEEDLLKLNKQISHVDKINTRGFISDDQAVKSYDKIQKKINKIDR